MGLSGFIIAISLLLGQPPGQELSEADIKQGKKHFLDGVRHLEKNRFEKAIASFRASYDLTKAPALMYNIGLAQKGAGDETAAMDSFSKFFPHAKPEQRKRVGNNIVEICNRAGSYEFCMSLIDDGYSNHSRPTQANLMAVVCDRFPIEEKCINRYKHAWEITKETKYLLSLSQRHQRFRNIDSAITTLTLYLELTPVNDDTSALKDRLKTLKSRKGYQGKIEDPNTDNNTGKQADLSSKLKTYALAGTAGVGLALTVGSSVYVKTHCFGGLCMKKDEPIYQLNTASAIITDISLAILAYHLWRSKKRTPPSPSHAKD